MSIQCGVDADIDSNSKLSCQGVVFVHVVCVFWRSVANNTLAWFRDKCLQLQLFSTFLIDDICWAPHILLPLFTLLQINVQAGPQTQFWLATTIACSFGFAFLVVAATDVVLPLPY